MFATGYVTKAPPLWKCKGELSFHFHNHLHVGMQGLFSHNLLKDVCVRSRTLTKMNPRWLYCKKIFFIYILKKKRLTISLVIFYFWSWLLFYFTTFSNTRKTDLCVEISPFFSNTVLLNSSDDNTSNIYIKLHQKVTHFHILRTEEQVLMLE